jgi:hypothetical protein
VLSTNSVHYQRKVYNIYSLLADIGGVMEIIIFLVGIVIIPISKFSFDLTAIKQLYLVRTADTTLFDKNEQG